MLQIEYRPVAALIPYARNSRTHSDDQVAQIAASIREFGFTNPVLLDKDSGIIAGHGRILAARKLKMDEVPTITLAHLTEAQRKALVIADNRIALNAGWDMDMLKVEIGELDGLDFDLTLLGFDTKELAGFLVPKTEEGLTDPDDTPETPSEPVSREGDVWVLGAHRLMCGDSTRADHVGALLGPVQPHLMVTDPPYGVDYDASWRDEALGGAKGGRATGKVKNDDRADWSDAWALFPGAIAYVWHGERQLTGIAGELRDAGFELRNLIVWAKSSLVIGRGHYHSQHETCWYAVRKGGTGQWAGDRKQTTLWHMDRPKKSETGHSTQKPVEAMKRPIENNSSPGQAVYEPFSGSGTTIIAGEMTGRSIYAMELSPAYVDVAATRWADFTGKVPVLEATGQTWAEVMAERNMSAVPVAKVAKPKKGKTKT
jgi:DNA modification methylase